ncbi:hypothetical protein CY34DRAFT_813246 [Suillus luteus UH-Slu-Lm8-n1]|uniref:Unplaced genomic scaffold CY34scaffold_706, whole genome shotgun sequence n=1 Tax=Suillus luteus UH-Slu-Lm8-n1 TaxID=930992 RepID=A0A0D0AI88_9AGAM|nr:hypothetical protein CY34DRAFT_813246 [Suillus luteus UH-Slu-Lm8-n1]
MLYLANQSNYPSIPLQSLTPSNFPSLRCEPRLLGAVHHCNVARPNPIRVAIAQYHAEAK